MIVSLADAAKIQERLDEAIMICLKEGLKFVKYRTSTSLIHESPTDGTGDRYNFFQVRPLLLDGATEANAGALFSAVADILRQQNRTWQVEVAIPN